MKILIRCFVDTAAIWTAGFAAWNAYGPWWATATAIAVMLYGFWCFYDGLTSK